MCLSVLLALMLLAAAAMSPTRAACPPTANNFGGVSVSSTSSNCVASVQRCISGTGSADGCCYYINGVRVSQQEAIAAHNQNIKDGSASSSVNCVSPDGSAQASSSTSTDNGDGDGSGSPSASASSSAGGGGPPRASASTTTTSSSSSSASPRPVAASASPGSASASASSSSPGATATSTSPGGSASATSSSGSPQPRATATASASSSTGCIGRSTVCAGFPAIEMARARYALMHPGQRLIRDVLCLQTNSTLGASEVCTTPTHIVTFRQQSQTMFELCAKLANSCRTRREAVFNFWASDPDAEIQCGELGVTQKVDNHVLAAHAWLTKISNRPRLAWSILRIFNL